jgi:hypothetical protein
VRAKVAGGGLQSGGCGQRVGGGAVGRGRNTGCDARSCSLSLVRPWVLHRVRVLATRGMAQVRPCLGLYTSRFWYPPHLE